jgi:hypothetical protein
MRSWHNFVVANVDKTSQIPHINVISCTFEGDDGDDVWQVRIQHHLCVTYKICAFSPSTQVAFLNGHYEATFANIKLLFY